MTNIQIESVRSPFDDPRVASRAVATLIRADAMGLLPRKVTCLDDSAIQCLGAGLDQAGICRRFLAELRRPSGTDPAHLCDVLEGVHEALDESPSPATEWPTLHEILGPELLASLTGISASSMRRYVSGTRPTPDAIAVRLHFLALVVADLAGAYNDIGVRRWFDRPAHTAWPTRPRSTARQGLVAGRRWTEPGGASSPPALHTLPQRDRLPSHRSTLCFPA